MLITPDVPLNPPQRMRALDGREYDVRTRADVRVMAADLFRMADAYQTLMRRADTNLV